MKPKNIYQDPLSVLFWWWDLAIFALMFPSNSLIVFCRHKLGFRLMRPWVFGLTFCVLMVISFAGTAATNASSEISPGASSSSPITPLGVFAIVMLGLSIYHRRRGWKLIFDTATPWHSMSRGESYLSKVFPMAPEHIIQRYVEPFLWMVIGLVLTKISAPLGMWILFSGAALAFIESIVLEKFIQDFLDRHDARVEAHYSTVIDESVQNRGSGPLPVRLTGGVPLMVSPELQRLIVNRQAAPVVPAVTIPAPIDTAGD